MERDIDMNRNHINVNITGTYVDDDGVAQEINVTHEGMNFVHVNAFKEDADTYTMYTSAAGRYSFDYLANMLEDFIKNRVGIELFPGVLKIAIKHVYGDDDGGEH